MRKTLEAVDLSGLKFIQSKADLIAAQVLYHSHSIKKASNTSHTRPCLNTKQIAVKVISKAQQPLINVEKK